MGYVMEHLYSVESARTAEDFIRGIARLSGSVAWTQGSWEFSENDVRPWNSLQNVPRDYMQLANHLLRVLRNTAAQAA
jgi:hypothetical protein